MIIKLAFDPLTTAAVLTGAPKTAMGAGAAALLYAKKNAGVDVMGSLVSGNLHDLNHYLTSKAHPIGKAIQQGALADIIMSTKKGTEGKVWANRRLLPSLLYSRYEAKGIATFESNAAARQVPFAKHLFKGNKLQVNRLKNVLRGAKAVDKAALAGQIAAPTVMGVSSFNNEYQHSHDKKKALGKGLIGAAEGGLISAGLEIPRRIAGASSKLHDSLMKDNGYGYGVLEGASKWAEKSMNRPGFMNYSKHFYTTPEKNIKATWGRLTGDNLKRLMGQPVPTGYDAVEGVQYGNEKKGILAKIDYQKDKILKDVGINNPA